MSCESLRCSASRGGDPLSALAVPCVSSPHLQLPAMSRVGSHCCDEPCRVRDRCAQSSTLWHEPPPSWKRFHTVAPVPHPGLQGQPHITSHHITSHTSRVVHILHSPRRLPRERRAHRPRAFLRGGGVPHRRYSSPGLPSKHNAVGWSSKIRVAVVLPAGDDITAAAAMADAAVNM